jgi:hypothetical protein
VYQDKYVSQIYIKGVVMDRPLHGPVEYLQAKIFLDTLVQKTHRWEALPLPIPDRGQDLYDLSEKQLSAYADFLRRLRGRPAKARAKLRSLCRINSNRSSWSTLLPSRRRPC